MLLIMMFTGTFDVMARYFFNSPIKGALEWSQLMMAGVTLLGWGYVQNQKGHISVDVMFRKYPESLKRTVTFFTLFLIAMFFFTMSWKSIEMGLKVLREGRMLQNLPLPEFPFRCFVSVGSFFLGLEGLLQLLETLRRNRRGGQCHAL